MHVTLVPVAKYHYFLKTATTTGSLHARHSSDEVNGLALTAAKENSK